MLKKISIITFVALLIGLTAWLVQPGTVGQAQVYYQTPTANAEGRILYGVKAGDTCLSVSLVTGVEITEIRRLNNLDEACTLVEGAQLLLGIYQTPTVTPGPPPTATPVLPTPTPFNGNGRVCVELFEDLNGNGLAEPGETMIIGGAVSISDRIGKVSLTANTIDGTEPLCFDDVPEGDYNVSVAPPEGYNATTTMNYPLKMQAGDQATLDFGAQTSSEISPAAEPEAGRSPLLAIVGGVLILGGIGVAIFM
ncbi:hypothetical protein EG834_07410, partial [bacterium]|nr:hypothetical protein [bacterium]